MSRRLVARTLREALALCDGRGRTVWLERAKNERKAWKKVAEYVQKINRGQYEKLARNLVATGRYWRQTMNPNYRKPWTREEARLIVAGIRAWDSLNPIITHRMWMSVKDPRIPYHINCRCTVDPIKKEGNAEGS